MTARVRRPLVASMSLVLPLAPSIRRFTGSESRATIATICRATTTLPWPTFMRRTAAPFLLFKVLDLLAHLLEDALARQRRLAQLEIVGLAGHGVHLTPELLQEEIERSPDWPALVEHERELGQVRPQPCQLFGNVGLVGPYRRLRHDPSLVHAGGAEQRVQPFAQTLLAPRDGDRRAALHRVDDRRELGVQAAQLLRQSLAFGFAAPDQLVEG